MYSQESDFKLEELFYSKTDFKGRLQSWNDVFLRVAEYSPEEMLNRPHNIIRHPDMPRSAFRLLWSYLQDGRPIGAYVKNRSKTGRYYWVFAIVFPMKDGYLSIRLKPTSKYLAVVQDLYKEILAKENQEVDLDALVALMLEKLKALGFESYDVFLRTTLLEEMENRERLLGAPGNIRPESDDSKAHPLGEAAGSCHSAASGAIRGAREIFAKTKELVKEAAVVVEACEEVRFITTNLSISSAKLGEAGRPLAAVSSNLEKLTAEIRDSSVQFSGIYENFLRSTEEMYFLVAVAKFQIEMMERLTKEKAQEATLIQNCQLLKELVKVNFQRVSETSTAMTEVNKSLKGSIDALIKITGGLAVVRIVGKIEIARLDELSSELSSRLAEMERLTEVFKNTLGHLEKECRRVTRDCLDLQVNIEKISQNLQKIDCYGVG